MLETTAKFPEIKFEMSCDYIFVILGLKILDIAFSLLTKVHHATLPCSSGGSTSASTLSSS
jgi:hypothetical protein